jgi:hypothetical protein
VIITPAFLAIVIGAFFCLASAFHIAVVDRAYLKLWPGVDRHAPDSKTEFDLYPGIDIL